jgi:hypothetical protein
MKSPLEIKQYMLVLTPNRGEWEIKHNKYRVYKEVDNIYELLYTNDKQYKLATRNENIRSKEWFYWAFGNQWLSNFIIKGYDNLNELLEENAELFI